MTPSRLLFGAARVLGALLLSLSVAPTAQAAPPDRPGHPDTVTVNGRVYRWPSQPTVVILVDGNDPEYVKAALDHGVVPNLRRMIEQGFAAVAVGAMPAFTNPNNMSVVTGVPPAQHGISGNFYFDARSGKDVMMNAPELLRADTILAAFSRQGARVVALTAKDKLARMLAKGIDLRRGVAFSSERADRCTLRDNGIADCLALVGRPLPDPYSAELSVFMLEAGLRLFERDRPDLMYLSTSDYLQHTYPPGHPAVDAFYAKLDDIVGRLIAAGARVAITADHGMNDKSRDDGSPNVIYLQDALDAALGRDRARVTLPITDPYVRHHGALGSFATVLIRDPALRDIDVMRAIRALDGVDLVLGREAAAREFALPADRIGDLIVSADRHTVFGTRRSEHDLSQLAGHRLRSHGGLSDRDTMLLFSRPLSDEYAAIAVSRPLRNFDAFDFALNGLR